MGNLVSTIHHEYNCIFRINVIISKITARSS